MIFRIFPETLFGIFGPFFGPFRPPDPENPIPYHASFTLSYFRPDPMGFDHFPSPFSFLTPPGQVPKQSPESP